MGIIGKLIPLKVTKIPSGTRVFDWTVPDEWNITDAYVKNPKGEKVVDFKKSSLHVMNYSAPVHKKLSLRQLKKHIYTLPEYPDRIPYVTSYYNRDWGFCMKHTDFPGLQAGIYEAFIDSVLEPGSLTYAEYYLRGKIKDEVLLSTYICHPSLANDNLSGIVLLTHLARLLRKRKLRYSYRFLFIPETIGALAWLSKNEKGLSRIKAGLVVTCVGDRGHMTYKKSRQGNSLIDRATEKALEDSGHPHKIIDFFPTGSDERQFCSPGFNLPVGSLMRTPYGKFSEYHTSADNLNFVDPKPLADSLEKYLAVINILENDRKYLNLNPKGEPQLGRHGLYGKKGSPAGRSQAELARLWVLNFSDGSHSLLDIAVRSGLKFNEITTAAQELFQSKLLKIINH